MATVSFAVSVLYFAAKWQTRSHANCHIHMTRISYIHAQYHLLSENFVQPVDFLPANIMHTILEFDKN